jgi:hypothetical protein
VVVATVVVVEVVVVEVVVVIEAVVGTVLLGSEAETVGLAAGLRSTAVSPVGPDTGPKA